MVKDYCVSFNCLAQFNCDWHTDTPHNTRYDAFPESLEGEQGEVIGI